MCTVRRCHDTISPAGGTMNQSWASRGYNSMYHVVLQKEVPLNISYDTLLLDHEFDADKEKAFRDSTFI